MENCFQVSSTFFMRFWTRTADKQSTAHTHTYSQISNQLSIVQAKRKWDTKSTFSQMLYALAERQVTSRNQQSVFMPFGEKKRKSSKETELHMHTSCECVPSANCTTFLNSWWFRWCWPLMLLQQQRVYSIFRTVSLSFRYKKLHNWLRYSFLCVFFAMTIPNGWRDKTVEKLTFILSFSVSHWSYKRPFAIRTQNISCN